MLIPLEITQQSTIKVCLKDRSKQLIMIELPIITNNFGEVLQVVHWILYLLILMLELICFFFFDDQL